MNDRTAARFIECEKIIDAWTADDIIAYEVELQEKRRWNYMGLDFGIVKKRKGEAYEANTWEDLVWGRNCRAVKEIVLENISTYDSEACEARLTIGTMNTLTAKLAEYIQRFDCNDLTNLVTDDYIKTVEFLGELSIGLATVIDDYIYEGIEYDFKLIDSY